MEDFGFERLGQTFDFALAQSVFTHITLNSTLRCLENVRRVLEPGGKFYATFLENPDIHNLEPVRRGGIRTHPDRDPYHYPAGVFGALTDMHTEHIGDWGHPRGASMLCFTKPH
jgi:SAM-dependent methyltransferase